jgi:glyoxylase-like metal-dependent hydrolase (beta-lactamase superfamily II)
MEKNISQSKDNHVIPMTSVSSGKGREVKHDVFYYTNQIVNLVFVGEPDGKWVLVDAGMPKSGTEIVKAAEERFGKGSKPEAIILTHGHFDHVGSIVHLLEQWEGVKVYAHPLEFPFLTGQQAYPEPDPTVEGGMLAKISKIYPHEPVDISPALLPLPADGRVPHLEDWEWIYTPGHTPGHVSFYRESDGVLIAGDAFVTVKQDEFYKVLVQKEEVCGPPPYLTTDWKSAKDSVWKLYGLNPSVAITGHGTHMSGSDLLEGLERLSKQFDEIALPKYGKYVDDQNNKSGN